MDVGRTQERSEQSAKQLRTVEPWRTAFGEYTLRKVLRALIHSHKKSPGTTLG
jgi:hypothetical protein